MEDRPGINGYNGQPGNPGSGALPGLWHLSTVWHAYNTQFTRMKPSQNHRSSTGTKVYTPVEPAQKPEPAKPLSYDKIINYETYLVSFLTN